MQKDILFPKALSTSSRRWGHNLLTATHRQQRTSFATTSTRPRNRLLTTTASQLPPFAASGQYNSLSHCLHTHTQPPSICMMKFPSLFAVSTRAPASSLYRDADEGQSFLGCLIAIEIFHASAVVAAIHARRFWTQIC